jgi:uncharacterized protein YerC
MSDQLDADFQQAVKYLNNLTEVYTHKHDTEVIEEIHSLQRQLASAFQARQTSVKDSISGERLTASFIASQFHLLAHTFSFTTTSRVFRKSNNSSRGCQAF